MHLRRSCSAFFDAVFTYKKLSAPRLRWLKTATRSGSNKEEKRSGPPVTPDLPLPVLRAVHTRSTPLSTTSHRTRLPLPQEVREPSTRSRMETASFHRLSAVARHQHRAPSTRSTSPQQHCVLRPSSDEILTAPSSEGVPTVASSPQPVTVSSASSHEMAAAAYTVQGGFDIAVSDNSLPPTVEQVDSSSMEQ